MSMNVDPLPAARGLEPETRHPRPSGWYCVALGADLAPGAVVRRVLFGRPYAIFRTEAGNAAVLGATCPHLGADLSGGRVCGERLECPFHRFAFDTTGACVATPYGGAPPRRARAERLPVREQDGFVLAWWDERGRAPTWVPEPQPVGQWLPPSAEVHTIASHPLDTTENSVDTGHFSIVHGFSDVTVDAPLEIAGPRLRARYGMRHAVGPLRLLNRFTIDAWGPGFSTVEVHVPALDLWFRLWVLATPVEDGRVALTLASSGPARARGRLHGPVLGGLVREIGLRFLVHDARQDFSIWSARRYVARPALAKGDGPIGAFRVWARQFDPVLAELPAPEAEA